MNLLELGAHVFCMQKAVGISSVSFLKGCEVFEDREPFTGICFAT